jgi:methyltransferase-like protein
MFRICKNHLCPEGIAYLSYNTYPGWHQRGILRDALRFHAPAEGSPLDRIKHAKKRVLAMLDDMPDRGSDYFRFLQREVKAIEGDSEPYLFHEFLEQDNHPIQFSDFAAMVASHGLRYVADARYNLSSLAQEGQVSAALKAFSDELIQQERYLDWLRNRHFRQSLICQETRQPTWKLAPRNRDALTIIGQAKLMSIDDHGQHKYLVHGEFEIELSDPFVVAILLVLSERWPVALTLGQLIEMATDKLPHDALPPGLPVHAALATTLVAGYSWGLWFVFAHTPPAIRTPGERPTVSALVRLNALRSDTTTNLLHRPVGLDPEERA